MRPGASRPLITIGAAVQTFCLIAVCSTLVACGGSNNVYPTTTIIKPTIQNYTLGGTISGLTTGSVVLSNGTATVTVAALASSWVFPASFAPGTSYSVAVQTQPADESCVVVSGGSGIDTGDVANVQVVCGFGSWNWQGGANTANATGVYGTLGTAAAANVPGARSWSSSWTDASGNFWLFGGVGYDSTGATGYLNDLWQYSPNTKQWTWVSGGSGNNANGVYGTEGTAAAGNVPGARQGASSWTDSSGNLWLFGGVGYASTGTAQSLNDLWRFSPSSGLWTWISGNNNPNAFGVYGTEGTAAAGNVPGARQGASSWTDSSGSLWLFGGVGDAAAGTGNLNDLWRFSPGNGLWTWIGGNNNPNAPGVYGTEGTADAGNVPGARYSANTWTDSSGNLWLFGGDGYDSAGSLGKLNDLWKYAVSSAQWTWVNGEDAADASGIYGTLGTAATGNVPGARQGGGSWIDGSGNLWLFGGIGYDSAGAVGNLSDLWEYAPGTNEWTWISGDNLRNPKAVYGTQGTGSVDNVPGGRNFMSTWIDSSGSLWLFGGAGYDSVGTLGYLNDLWQYTPGTGT